MGEKGKKKKINQNVVKKRIPKVKTTNDLTFRLKLMRTVVPSVTAL